MKHYAAVALCTSALLLGLCVSVQAGPSDQAAKPLCPISGEAIDFSVSTATDDGPVFFCCKGCIKKFDQEPAKFATEVAAQRKALEPMPKVQLTCPISGEAVDTKVFIEHQGQKVFFCCPKCAEKYKAEPDKYKGKLANSYTYQTKCPVMGGKINPKVHSTLPSGLKIYHCCPGCIDKFLKDPAKYWPNLEAQKFVVDLKSATKAT